MKKKNKIIMAIGIFLCLIVLVNATLNTYFGKVDTEITVEQSVTIDHNPYNKPLCHSITINSGDFVTYKHTVYNDAKTCNVSINQTTVGLTSGLTLIIKYMNETVVKFPFILSCGEKVELQFIYSADINLKAKVYKIKTYFSCKEV